MEKTHKIVIEINQKGEITAKAEGFTGGACLKEIQAIMDGLNLGGADITHTGGGGADDQNIKNIQKNTQN
jgi:hypothetical protein